MPSNLLTADTTFPTLTQEQSTDEKFEKITSYLYMLLEQLRYSMGNLDKENFNDAGLEEIANIITEPVYVQLKDDEANIAALTVTAAGLGARLSDAEGNITQLTATTTSLTSRISSAEGSISTLQQTATSLTSRISDAEGNISSLTQTVNGMTLSVTNGSSSSTIRLLANGVQLSSQSISFSGMVSFTDLSTSGWTTINGDNITTGTIEAIDIYGCTIEGSTFKRNRGRRDRVLLPEHQLCGGRHPTGRSGRGHGIRASLPHVHLHQLCAGRGLCHEAAECQRHQYGGGRERVPVCGNENDHQRRQWHLPDGRCVCQRDAASSEQQLRRESMYLIECANAYLAAVQLQQKEMDYQTAFAVMMVKKQLQSHVEFLQNEELKLAEKYAEKDEKGNIKWTERGTFPYRDADAAAGYQRERRALGMTQVEDDFTVQHAPVPEKITPMQLEALEKFIVFGGEG